MVRCLTGARFTMNAEVLRQVGDNPTIPDNVEPEIGGNWESYQDPITGAILNRWVPTDDQSEPLPDGSLEPVRTIDCLARGIVDGGIRVAGTTERFGDTYENIDFVKMWTPPRVRLSKRDRITNIRAKKGGAVVWIDEEYLDGTRPTVFNVNGVTPLFDAFNNHVENFVLLEKVSY
jgi:hypothetical protein